MLWLYERKPMFFYNKRLKNVITGPNGPGRRFGGGGAGMKASLYRRAPGQDGAGRDRRGWWLSFFLIRLAPGDAATVMAGQSGYADEAFMKICAPNTPGSALAGAVLEICRNRGPG